MKNLSDAWSRTECVLERDLPEFAWLRGFYYVTGAPDGRRMLQRNFQELYTRDAAVAALGDIKGKVGLDVGGGDGTYAIVLSSLGAKVLVQDLNPVALARGRQSASRLGFDIEFLEGDAVRLHCETASMDFCFSADFLEHVSMDVKRSVIAEMYRVLKPGGVIVVKTPNLTYLKMVLTLKRVANLLRFRSPRIFIPHTRNNPDSEHCGLVTFAELDALFAEHFFGPADWFPLRLRRAGIPRRVARFLFGRWWATEHIIVRYRKSFFVPLADSLP